jgi:hypothetical protein
VDVYSLSVVFKIFIDGCYWPHCKKATKTAVKKEKKGKKMISKDEKLHFPEVC